MKANVVFQKGKEKAKRKRKEDKEKEQSWRFALKPEHGPRGIWRKPLKPDALNLSWLGVIDLVFVIRLDELSLACCRCLILEII